MPTQRRIAAGAKIQRLRRTNENPELTSWAMPQAAPTFKTVQAYHDVSEKIAFQLKTKGRANKKAANLVEISPGQRQARRNTPIPTGPYMINSDRNISHGR
jgi:hypothetical protein